MTDQIKLNFAFDNVLDCDVATHNGYRIKAERDESPSNPFEDSEGHWPMLVLSDGEIMGGSRTGQGHNDNYECPSYGSMYVGGFAISRPIERFNPEQLIFNQVHIAKALGYKGVRDILDAYEHEFDGGNGTDPLPGWCNDAEALRNVFYAALGDVEARDKLEALKTIFGILAIPAYVGTSTGYCQGDQVEVLVVATPEAQAKYGCENVTEDDMKAQVDLYGAWAWGDCYGYIIERPSEVDEDGEVTEWEEIEHGSCWGYYGTDHEASGLADAALEAVPAEAPEMPVCEAELEDA